MADRAAELRALMKNAGAGGAAALTGKDKAKYLKLVKEKKKAEDISAAQQPQVSRPISVVEVQAAKDVQQKPVRIISNLLDSAQPKPATQQSGHPAAQTTNEESEDVGVSKKVSSLPVGFFDDEPVVISSNKGPTTTTQTVSMDVTTETIEEQLVAPAQSQSQISKSLEHEHQLLNQPAYRAQKRTDAAAASITDRMRSQISSSSLPVGFFDDVSKEMQARGVTLKQQDTLRKKVEEDALASFLGEIDEIKESSELESTIVTEEVDEQEVKVFEDEAAQLTYMTKVAVLLHQSEKVLCKKRRQTEPQQEQAAAASSLVIVPDEKVEATAKEAELLLSSLVRTDTRTTSTVRSSSSNGNSSTAAHSEVQEILRKQLEAKRRKIGEVSGSDSGVDGGDDNYNPLDFMDWTARSL